MGVHLLEATPPAWIGFLTEALWPFVILVLVSMYRGELRRIFKELPDTMRRIQSGKGFGFEVQLAETAAKGLPKADEASKQVQIPPRVPT